VSWRALIVTAHPDDLEFAAGGTVARWADQGAEVTVCVATDGSSGTQDRELMGKRLQQVRVQETEAAAAVLGVAHVEWLGYKDAAVEYTMDLRRDLSRVFRKFRPHRLGAMDPTPIVDGWFINHPDHRAIGQATLDACVTGGTTPNIFPELLEEGLEPWRGLIELWIAGPQQGPEVVDIGDTIDRKIDALLCHKSQVGEDREQMTTWIKEWAARAGEPHGLGFAETFRVLRAGPGFHAGEQDEVDFTPGAPPDPRA